MSDPIGVELPPEFLALRLVRLEKWRRAPDGRAVLLLPRFRRGILARWLQPKLRGDRSHLRVNLDPLGSFVWEGADGETTMETVLAAMRERFPGTAELPQRVRTFVDRLLYEGFLAIAGSGAAPSAAPSPAPEPLGAPGLNQAERAVARQ